MPNAGVQGMVGRCLELPGHFVGPVTIEHARPLGGGAELRVRLAIWCRLSLDKMPA